ncbi:sensor domain-containing protein [Nocardiopsis halotolerans]|uniref:sensor domain-containing protein n=1 Tax=Nocardiopsis halotolerans TaxID=124252 RepID=UPI00034BFE22|nr:sensor domain-containing protein [Nocardiopsis halotolerans]
MNATRLLHRLLADTRHSLLGLPMALVSFVVCLTGLAAGTGTAVVGVGLFLLVGTLYTARGFAHVERVRLTDLVGRPVVRRPYRSPASGAGPLRRALAPLSCPQSWLDALHAVVYPPVSVVGFALATTWWTGALAGLLHPLWGWSLYTIPGYTGVGAYVLPESPVLATTVVHMLGGALFALTLPLVVRACAHAQATLGRALLLAPEDPSVGVHTAVPDPRGVTRPAPRPDAGAPHVPTVV